MSDKIKIKVTIADRVYPLTIKVEEEEGVRRAVSNIKKLSDKFSKSYAVQDKQDVLAMCALQFASRIEVEKMYDSSTVNLLDEKLTEINQIMDDYLNK